MLHNQRHRARITPGSHVVHHVLGSFILAQVREDLLKIFPRGRRVDFTSGRQKHFFRVEP